MIRWLVDPYQTQFMRHAALTAVIVGVLSPIVGVWVVLRRLAYLGDAMSHATLAGMAGAYLLGVSVTLGALAAGLVTGDRSQDRTAPSAPPLANTWPSCDHATTGAPPAWPGSGATSEPLAARNRWTAPPRDAVATSSPSGDHRRLPT